MTELIEIAASLVANPQMAETGANLINKLFDKPCEVAGGMLSDQLYYWQWKNRIRIATRASQILEENGIAAKVLPAGFLVPLLDSAGDIEDETLQEMWAKLLVSGIEDEKYQHPAFIPVLKNLSVNEVRILEVILKNQDPLKLPFRSIGVSSIDRLPPLSVMIDWEHAASFFDESVSDTSLLPELFDHLDSLDLISSTWQGRAAFITCWGASFLSACLPPSL